METTWSVIDIALAVPLLLAAWRGFRKGLIIEIATLVGLVAGLFAGYYGADRVAQFVSDASGWKVDNMHAVGFLIAFAGVLFAVYLLGKALEKIVDLVALGLVNKLLGMVFGLVKMTLLLSVVIYFMNLAFGKDQWLPKEQVDASFLYPKASNAASWLIPELKQSTLWERAKERAEEGADRLRETIEDH